MVECSVASGSAHTRASPSISGGVDHVGRRKIKNTVVAAAVRFEKRHNIIGLADSKVLSPQMRIKLYFEILETFPVGVSFLSVKAIDNDPAKGIRPRRQAFGYDVEHTLDSMHFLKELIDDDSNFEKMSVMALNDPSTGSNPIKLNQDDFLKLYQIYH